MVDDEEMSEFLCDIKDIKDSFSLSIASVFVLVSLLYVSLSFLSAIHLVFNWFLVLPTEILTEVLSMRNKCSSISTNPPNCSSTWCHHWSKRNYLECKYFINKFVCILTSIFSLADQPIVSIKGWSRGLRCCQPIREGAHE